MLRGGSVGGASRCRLLAERSGARQAAPAAAPPDSLQLHGDNLIVRLKPVMLKPLMLKPLMR